MIVIDSNIFIAALLKDSTTRRLIITSGELFLFPEIIFDEITAHREELINKSGLSRKEYDELVSRLLKSVVLVKSETILPHRKEACEIMKKIDPSDVPFIATALAFKGAAIWTNDKHFEKQKTIKTIKTKDLL
jgi:predicted nucleic acid-binding protein